MRFVCLLALLAAAAIVSPAGAVIIDQLEPALGVSLADANWHTPTSVDGHIAVPLTARFYSLDMLGAAQIIQFKRQASDSGQNVWVVNYDNATGSTADSNFTVQNAMTVDWTEFHILLTNDPTFASTYADARFVNPGGVTSDVFAAPVSAGNDLVNHYGYLDFEGGPVPYGSNVSFNGIQIQTNGNSDGVFYLKLIPVPEPATLCLTGLGGLVLAARRRRGS